VPVTRADSRTFDRAQLRLAAQLLAKAEGTEVDVEAVAFIERSYRLLAQVITAHDVAVGDTSFGPRRRERRLLRDRRAGRPRGGSERAVAAANPIVNYRSVAREAAPATDRVVDRRL
jgi:hypothetical protein